MSFGAGHILDMINRMKQNAALKPSRRPKFRDYREQMHSSDFKRTTYDFPRVSAKKLEELKRDIRRVAGRERRRQFAALLLISVVVSVAAVLFLSKPG
ncbi:hypothetical protein [Sinomicrobium weinanense]|uniref:Uncharacterized protein n=1 Tax=Sinomicrobium weinanense TaxID=2842200 RepID=A0A926JPE3_9FLAO|nr:hypothetical protein [Sinomicrobium weinanense]MBC9794847.1 hypothetical protein [Sinomicrobium weinanense]MBU3125618.1 hypothetical protein [Sinomicrobium weinanense]